ncbi:uncharacterized protein [Oncorhynchus clarkii lewisi]|uniref:uncharacterized protein n=1 Tax=Oncorhynchus clarkii lewisi TaxID=490388 RepID=UPI0039B87A10
MSSDTASVKTVPTGTRIPGGNHSKGNGRKSIDELLDYVVQTLQETFQTVYMPTTTAVVVMEGTHSTLRLYQTIRERSSVRPFILTPTPIQRGPGSSLHKTASLRAQPIISHHPTEEGPVETVQWDQSGELGFKKQKQSFEEDSKADGLGSSSDSELHWLADLHLLPLCSECKARVGMGNQGGKLRHLGSEESQDGCSPRLPPDPQATRRRRTGGMNGTSSLQHTLTRSPGTPRTAGSSKRMRLKRLWKMSARPAEETLQWGAVESSPAYPSDGVSNSNFTERRNTVMRGGEKEKMDTVQGGREREKCSKSPTMTQEAKRPCTVPSSAVLDSLRGVLLSENHSCSLNKVLPFEYHYSSRTPREVVTLKEESVHIDSDTELSEYDNEFCNISPFPSKPQEVEDAQDSTRQSPEGGSNQALSPSQEGGRAEKGWRMEMKRKEAAWRVMEKIEEVEGIIRRVSLTSADWIKEGREGSVFDLFTSTPDVSEEESVSETKPESSFQLQPELQDWGTTLEDSLPAEEIHALGEALSQSLRRALRMEGLGEDEDWEAVRCRETTWNINLEQTSPELSWDPIDLSNGNTMTFDPMREWKRPSSPSLLDNSSLRTSSSFNSMSPMMSPILSPLSSLLSSPRLIRRPLPRSLSQPVEEMSEGRRMRDEEGQRGTKNSAPCHLVLQGGSCNRGDNSDVKVNRGQVGDKKGTRKRVAWLDLRLNEQNQNDGQRKGDSSWAEPGISSLSTVLSSDESLRRQEEIWQRDESLKRQEEIWQRDESLGRQEEIWQRDESLRRQDIWHREVEESLSYCRPLSRPKHVDFLRITPLEDDITSDSPFSPLRLRASTPGDGEDRSTPGRLQAIWPPTKEEKVGLKYTEAEHQAALLQLKRECNEEMEKIQDDFGKQLRQVRGDNEERVFHLECNLARLQSDLALGAHHRRGDLRDVAVSTGDDLSQRTVHNVCVQTDRQTFIRTPEDEEGGVRLGPQPPLNVPKRLGLASISLNLSGQATSPSSPSSSPLLPPPPPPPPFPKQTQGLDGPPPTSTPGCNPQPPPPPPGYSPPPPPPPPGCVPPPPPGVLVDKPHRKPAVEPACPMKPLYWTRIQIQDNKDTLWTSLVEPDIINTTEFEDLFSKTTLQTKKKPLSEAYEKKAKAKKVIKLLDGKRSQAVGILISSLHLEMNDIQQAVLTVDNSIVDMETIQALYENRAQPDELEQITRHYHTSEEELIKLLDKPEQFLYELSQIPDFPGRASCIIFQSVFIDAIASVQRKVDIVSRVCKDLLETSSVREVMGLVLALGNHMNGGNRTRGQADGFGLEILPKLKDVKSRDNRISLVDYVVSYYLRNLDENAGTERSVFPLPEPQDVFLSAQVKFEDVTKELRQLRRDLTVCEKGVQKVCSSSPDEHLQPFKDKMEAFVLIAHKEHDDVHAQLMFAQKSFHELVTFLGLKPKTGETEVATGHFFMLWFEFCTDFMTRWRRENKNISKERLKEAQLSVKKITADKKVETRKINPNSLKERLRQKEANMVATS